MQLNKGKKLRGFTLVELIVVIAIIGVLAAVLTIAVVSYVQDSRRAQATADAKLIENIVMARIYSPSGGGSPLRVALAAHGENDDYIITYDGTGMAGKSDVVQSILTEIRDTEYNSGFVIFIENAGSKDPSIMGVYVYAITPSDANAGSLSVEPDGSAPVGLYDRLNP